MTRTTVPASKGSATFADSQVVVDLTVLNTLPGDVVEIIDDTSLAVLGTAVQVGTSTTWRASLSLPSSKTMVNLSARNRRGLAYSSKLANPFAISYPIGPASFSSESASAVVSNLGRTLTFNGYLEGWRKGRTANILIDSVYFEIKIDSKGLQPGVGVGSSTASYGDYGVNAGDGTTIFYFSDGRKRKGSLYEAYGDTFTTGDVIGVGLKILVDTFILSFWKNGVPQGIAYQSPLSFFGGDSIVPAVANYGDSFAFSMPEIVRNQVSGYTLTSSQGYSPAPTPTGAYRYWRVYITSNNGDDYTSLQQVELRTSVGGVSVCPISPVTSQSDFYNTNDASRLCNRDYTTIDTVPWESATGVLVPHWIYIDLGSSMKIIEAAIFCQNFSNGPARAPKDFLIQGSDDSINWTTYTTVTGINNWIAGTGKVFAVQPGLVLTA